LAIDANDSYSVKAIEYYQDQLINGAMTIIERIEGQLSSSVEVDWKDYDRALVMFEETKQIEPPSLPDFGYIFTAIDIELQEVNTALQATELIGERLTNFEKELEVRSEGMPCKAVEIESEDMESFIRSVEEKAMTNYTAPHIEYEVLNSITREEFPLFSALFANMEEEPYQPPDLLFVADEVLRLYSSKVEASDVRSSDLSSLE
jgi:hypothetical protein